MRINFRVRLLMALSLCISLSILPAVAYDFTLTIFGNANMDDIIDESDITFLKKIIAGTQNATAFSDANYDGMIDEKDIYQIESIIKGNETALAFADGVGRNLTVNVPAEKIVTLAGSYGPEMLLAFGIQPEAITEQSKSHAVQLQDIMENIPTVGTYQEPDIEAIMKLNPQLVHCYESRYIKAGSYEKLEANLKDVGINLVALDFHNPSTFNNAIRIMGYLLGNHQRADSLIDFEESNMNLIKERTKKLTNEQRTSAYLESSKDLATRGPGDATYESIILCGGRSIFEDISDPYPTVESESVIQRDPQVIIKVPDGLAATDSAEPLESLRDNIADRTGWENIDAVKNNRIYVINGGTKSVHNSIFCLFLAKALHPDLFKDIDPEAIYRQWYNKFLGLDNDLMVVYPPSESWQ